LQLSHALMGPMTQSNILFVCNQNSVRSPMAAALLRLTNTDDAQIDSAGVYEGGLDPFVEIVMKELDVEMNGHEPKTLREIDIGSFDRIIALTPEAAIAIRERAPDAPIEFWEVENPSEERGGRNAVIDAYRRVREELAERLKARFPQFYKKP
jgi:protein-tyrosine-phosphatase